MKLALVKGATSVTVHIFIQDSTSTTGAGKPGLAFNTAGLTAYYVRPRAAAVAITLATQTVTGAYASGGFVEIDATNMPGWYRLDVPDAAVASGVDHAGVHLKGAAGMAPLPLEIQLTDFNLNDADPDVNVVKFGGTAGTFAAGRPDVNTSHVAGTAQTAGDLKASLNTIDDFVDTEIADIQSRLPAALVGGRIAANAEVVGDKTGYALSAAAVQAIWDALTSALTTVGSIGKLVVDNLNAAITSRSSHSAADVWSSAARTLTAATNITSTGGTTVPQTGDSFARLGAPAGLSVSADVAAVKAETAAILTDTAEIGAAGAGLTAITGARLSAAGVDDILDEPIGDSTITLRQALKLAVAALGGKLSGAGTTTVTIRDAADLADRITATVDADGNRSAVTLNL